MSSNTSLYTDLPNLFDDFLITVCKASAEKFPGGGANEKKQDRKIAPLSLSLLSVVCMKIQGRGHVADGIFVINKL